LEFVFDLFAMPTMWKAFSKFTCFFGGLRFRPWIERCSLALRSLGITSSKSADGFKSFNRGFLDLSNFAFWEAAPSRIVNTAWIVGLRAGETSYGVGGASLMCFGTLIGTACAATARCKVCYVARSNPTSRFFDLCYSPSFCRSFAAARYPSLFCADSCFNFAAKLTL
jgi:hypothetical protein